MYVSGSNVPLDPYTDVFNYSVPVVIIKKYSSTAEQKKEIKRECYVLKELERSENFIRFLDTSQIKTLCKNLKWRNFLKFAIFFDWHACIYHRYIAVEKCIGSVADRLLKTPTSSSRSNKRWKRVAIIL